MNKKLIKGVNVALLGAVFVLALFLVFPNVMADETYTNPLIEQELEVAAELDYKVFSLGVGDEYKICNNKKIYVNYINPHGVSQTNSQLNEGYLAGIGVVNGFLYQYTEGDVMEVVCGIKENIYAYKKYLSITNISSDRVDFEIIDTEYGSNIVESKKYTIGDTFTIDEHKITIDKIYIDNIPIVEFTFVSPYHNNVSWPVMLKKGEILYDGLFSVDINIKEINSDAPYVIFGIVNTNNPSNNKSLFSIQNITSAMCVEENSGYFSFSWTSDVILGDNFDYYLNVYDLKDNKLVVRVPYMMGNNETVSSNKLEKDVWHQKARVFFENTSCDDYYYAQIEATDGLKSLVSNKYRFTWDDQQATLDWYKADDISMQINGVNVSTNNNLVFGIQHMEPLPEPLEVTLSYTAELPNSIKELPTVLFMEKVNTRSNGASDKFVFYPVNTGVSCNITDSNSLSDSLDKDTCTYTYKTDIYTSIKPNELYELTYKVYPELESDIISKEAIQDGRKYIKILSTKIKFSSQTLFNSEFIDRDVSEFYNSFTNKNVITRNVNPSELRNISDKEMVAIRNTKTPLKIKVPTKIMEDDVAINDVDPNINRKINRRNAKITDVDPSSILISEDSDDLYVQKNKVIKKLISFDKVIEEQEINSENIIGDIELVDVDDTLSYIFQIKEKRRFLGINIGDKIVYKTMNAIEDIN